MMFRTSPKVGYVILPWRVVFRGEKHGALYSFAGSRLGMEEDAMVQRLNHMQDRWAPMSRGPPRKATWEFRGFSENMGWFMVYLVSVVVI